MQTWPDLTVSEFLVEISHEKPKLAPDWHRSYLTSLTPGRFPFDPSYSTSL